MSKSQVLTRRVACDVRHRGAVPFFNGIYLIKANKENQIPSLQYIQL